MILLVSYGKQLSLMNYLGGMWRGLDYVEWLHRSHVYGGRVYHTCGRPPRNKEIIDILAH